MSLREYCSNQLTSFSFQRVRTFDSKTVLPAALFGAGLFLWSMCLWVHFGGTVEGRLAVLMALFLGFASRRLVHGASQRLVTITLAIWTIAQAVFVDFIASMMRQVPYSFLESLTGQTLFIVLVALVGLAPGVAFGYAICRHNAPNRPQLGSALGAVSGVVAAWIASIFCPLAWLLGLLALTYVVHSFRSGDQALSAPEKTDGRSTARLASFDMTLAIACGLTLGVAVRFVGQWFLWTPTTWACVLVCGAIASAFRVRWNAASLVGIASGGLLIGYPLMIHVGLFSAASFDSVPAQIASNCSLICLSLLLPFVAMWAIARRRPTPLTLLPMACGASAGLLALFPVPAILTVSATIALMATIAVPRRRRFVAAAIGSMLAVAGFVFDTYQPESLASLLHAPTARLMAAQGNTVNEILAADDARFVESIDVADGVLTAWSQRGFQVAINEDERSLGTLTQRTDLGPCLGAETMSVVLPVTLHEAPRRLVICGAGNGESVLAVTEFGIPVIEVVDSKSRMEFLKKHSGERGDCWNDERVVTRPMPAHWLSHCRPLGADVLVVNLPGAGRLQGAGTQTAGHVRGLSRHLAPGGIVCQRIDVNGLDATTVLSAAAAFRDVFQQVHAFEISVGQWVVIGTHESTPLVNIGLVDQLKRHDVRRLLGQVGWDWSVVLKLYTLGPDELTQAIAKANVATPTMASSHALRTQAFTSTSRNSAKFDSFKTQISPFVTRSLDRLDDAGLIREVEARIADSTERDRLLGESTDDFWGYRTVLRDRLKTRPRAAIQQVGYSDEFKQQLHPEDVRRKEFLAALGVAISNQDAAVLDRFIEPYDPLVSPFIYGEAAKIHAESNEPEASLDDLVASVFKTYNDMSVRNAVQALNYVCDGYGGNDITRYDLAQGLLEQMRRRWHARITSGNESLVRSEILRESIDQTREAFATLDSIVENNPSLDSHWAVRKPVLRRDLVERMRMHQRAEQEKRLLFEQKKAFLKAERDRKKNESKSQSANADKGQTGMSDL